MLCCMYSVDGYRAIDWQGGTVGLFEQELFLSPRICYFGMKESLHSDYQVCCQIYMHTFVGNYMSAIYIPGSM